MTDNTNGFALLFFAGVALLGNYVLLNLILAVLKLKFSKQQRQLQIGAPDENVRGRNEMHRFLRTPNRSHSAPLSQEQPNFIVRFASGAMRVASQALAVLLPRQRGDDELQDAPVTTWGAVRQWLRDLQATELFNRTFMLLILINTGAMASESDGMANASVQQLETLNRVLTVAFTVEVLVKVRGGGRGWVRWSGASTN